MKPQRHIWAKWIRVPWAVWRHKLHFLQPRSVRETSKRPPKVKAKIMMESLYNLSSGKEKQQNRLPHHAKELVKLELGAGNMRTFVRLLMMRIASTWITTTSQGISITFAFGTLLWKETCILNAAMSFGMRSSFSHGHTRNSTICCWMFCAMSIKAFEKLSKQ